MRIAVPALGLLLFVTAAVAAEVPEFPLAIRDHRFTPAEIRVPANVKVRLVVDNQDAAPEPRAQPRESDSREIQGHDFHRAPCAGPLSVHR
jgi:hypothetical protein